MNVLFWRYTCKTRLPFLVLLVLVSVAGCTQLYLDFSYHFLYGKQLLIRANLLDGYAPGEAIWLRLGPVDKAQARSLLEHARVVYQDEIVENRENIRAYIWLGRVAMLLDDTDTAVNAFSTAVNLQQDNSLGWWGLGLAYRRLAEKLGEVKYQVPPPDIASASDLLNPSVRTNPAQRAGLAWRIWGITVEDMIRGGEIERKANRYEEALKFYDWASLLSPELGDSWFFAGLIYEQEEKWERALEAYGRTVEDRRLVDVHRSSPYYKMGVIYHWNLFPRETGRAVLALEKAISINDFQDDWQAADAHYRFGALLRQQGLAKERYAAEFEKAIEIYPGHGLAHTFLGIAYYELYGDVGLAEKEIGEALRLNPTDKWAYLHLGDVYRKVGRCVDAQKAYQEALEIDPLFDLAISNSQVKCD